ncbi:MAG: YggS family pyridoxal phosphate-dependent enzyme [candidate division Zixibacteria bacterium]|nr:YggS family pyridoxal phosphate-dependent enzyme [candidate division Zixibacteria bacterium]
MLKNEISANYAEVKEKISNVCRRIGIDENNITIVAITKTHTIDVVKTVIDCGIKDVGESRIQEAETKIETVRKLGVNYHFVGHLQSNKVRKAVEMFDLIHSVDSVKIAKVISDESKKAGRRMKLLLQLNCSGEASKSGFQPDEIVDTAGEISEFEGIEIKGIMTIGPWVEDEGMIRDDFRMTKKKFDEVKSKFPKLALEYLSMGMSGDYQIAIEEGANMIRLGTVLFGHRS